MTTWTLLDTGIGSAHDNMEIDRHLLENLRPDSQPILHLYEWEGCCATYGYFTKPEQFLQMESVESGLLNIARRPTGGGVIFHLTDLAFSVLIPANHPRYSVNTLENYSLVNSAVAKTIEEFSGKTLTTDLLVECSNTPQNCPLNFCMAKPTIYDVMINGQKVGGAAQRRTKNGLLHQGSISIALPPLDFLKKTLVEDSGVLEAMQTNTFCLINSPYKQDVLNRTRETLKKIISSNIFKL